MSLFEFTFGLQSIILGLALTHLVVSLNRLVLARERVRWAAQPLLAAALVFVSILLFWSQSWTRQTDSTTVGAIILSVLVNLLIFAAAAAVLPDEAPEDRTTDLGAHFDRHRVYFFSLYALPIIITGVVKPLVQMALGQLDRFDNWPNLIIVGVMAVCIVTRNRWVNIGLMTVLLLWMVSMISGYRLMTG